jgi:Zn finger protein HypA/HybF involved in hydrogenase expression
MTVLRLFVSEQDAIEDRREARRARARAQSRCRCCGKFTRPQHLAYGGTVCDLCRSDASPRIAHKVDQARRWAQATKTA